MNQRKKIEKSRFLDLIELIPREYLVFGFFILFTLYILSTGFSYTVIKYDFYKALADNQQVGEVEIPVTRGNIYATSLMGGEKKPILATSVELSDLAVDPQIPGDINKLQEFLTGILYKEMCDNTEQETCYRRMLRFLKKSEILGFSYSQVYIEKQIGDFLNDKLSQTKVTTVLLRSGISPDEEREIISWRIPGVYINNASLYINPEEIQDQDALADIYSEFFREDREDTFSAIRKRELRYIPLYQKLSLNTSDEIKYYMREENKALQQGIIEKEESIGGFILLNPNTQRVYPEGNIGSQIVGFVDNSGSGHYGVEGYFHNELKGDPGALVGKKDILGRPIEAASFGDEDRSSEEGVDIYTTIDRNIQKKTEEILEAGVKRYRANKGTIVIMEPKTGKVLSLANYPKYDPNSPGEVYTLQKVDREIVKNPKTDLLGKIVFVEDIANGDEFFFEGKEIFLREALREEYVDDAMQKYIYTNNFGAAAYKNDAISSLYEPGSIMKAITVAVGIDTGEIQAHERYNDVGKVTIDNFTIRNDSSKCFGNHTFTHALSYSCNVGMIRIVQRVGKSLLHKYLYDFGFGELSGIELDGEVFGKIDPYQRWPVAKLLTTSYGLGISVTPLQMAAAYSVIANGGIYMKPYIVEKVVSPEGKVIDYAPEQIRRVLRQDTADIVSNMLVKGVEGGAAANGKIDGYTAAGKTGTAQIAYRGRYETGIGSTYASFAGFAPAEDPKFVIVIKLERPRQNQYGGQTSAYIFSELAEELLKYYQIPKKEQE